MDGNSKRAKHDDPQCNQGLQSWNAIILQDYVPIVAAQCTETAPCESEFCPANWCKQATLCEDDEQALRRESQITLGKEWTTYLHSTFCVTKVHTILLPFKVHHPICLSSQSPCKAYFYALFYEFLSICFHNFYFYFQN